MEENEKDTFSAQQVFKNINEVIPYIGPFGKFQKLLTGIFCIMIIPGTYQILIMYFGALSPAWKCAANSSVCLNKVGNKTLPNTNAARCAMARKDWDFSEPAAFSIRTQFDIYCDKEWIVHLITSLFFLSWAIGAVVLGWVADTYGRKIVLFPSIGMVMLFGFISAFSPNVTILIICRIVIGFFTPGTGVQMVVLLAEFVSTKYRPAAVTIVWFFFSVALCLLGLKAYYIREWKILFIVVSAPYILVVLFFRVVPESIRWLHVHGKNEELVEAFHRIARWNKRPLPEGFTILPHQIKPGRKVTPLELFKTKRMMVKTLVQGFGWLVNGLVYFGLSLAADDLGGSLYRNYVLLSAVEFPANLSTIYLCEKIGRKKTTAGTMVLGSIACVTVAFIPSTGTARIIRVLLGILGKCFITISFSAIYTWSLEIYPTDIRAQGMGFLQIASRIGAASSPWIAKGLKSLHTAAPFLVMSIVTFVSAILLLLLPETKGVPAKDSSFEEEDEAEPLEEVGFVSNEKEMIVS